MFASKEREFHIVIKKMVESGDYKTVYDQPINNTTLKTEKVSINSMTLCNADNSRKMKIEFYKIRSTGE